MKSFFDYNKNELKEETKGSSKIIVSKPIAGDKFVLCNNQFGLDAGTVVTIAEESGEKHQVGFGLSVVNINTPKGILTLQGSTKLIQESFNPYIEPLVLEEESKVVVVNKTIQQTIVEEGTPGERGAKGEQGPRGFQGPVGDRGPKGEKGEKGDQGEKGDTGEQGIPGIQGPQGERGEKGEQGDRGDVGPQGLQGKPGSSGKQGKDGKPGSQGPKGDRGEPGPKGDTGSTGATGAKGEKGDKGETGLAGKDGKNGKDGKDGKDGKPGKQGDKGDQGEPGPSGIISASYPLVYDAKARSLSFDSTKIEKLITSLSGTKGTFDLTSLGGGAVGIQFNKAQIIKSVSDINFTGSGVNVVRKGKNVEVQISGVTGGSGVPGGSNTQIQFNDNGSFAGSANLTWEASATAGSGQTASFLEFKNRSGIKLYENPINGTNFISFVAPYSVTDTTGYPYIFPQGSDAPLNSYLSVISKSNGQYTLGWAKAISATTISATTSINLTNNSFIQFNDGTTQGTASNSFTEGLTAPASPIPGDRWFRTDEGILYTAITNNGAVIWVEL